jgi:hypothetical protein
MGTLGVRGQKKAVLLNLDAKLTQKVNHFVNNISFKHPSPRLSITPACTIGIFQ